MQGAEVSEETTDSSKVSARHQRLDAASAPSQMLLITANAKKAFSAPNITSVGPSDVLSRVKSFLPQMAAGHEALQQRLEQDPEEAARMNIENIDDCKDGKVIEMNIALVEGLGQDEDGQENDDSDSSWSEDSEPDSPASPPRPGGDNDFTSDTDSDSTVSTSSGSSSDDGQKEKDEKPSTSKAAKTQKRVLVQEMPADNKKKPKNGMM